MNEFLSVPGADSLWSVAWQTTLALAAGLLAAALCRRRPSRADSLLMAGVAAALLAPLVTLAVQELGWGVLAAGTSTEQIAERGQGAGRGGQEVLADARTMPNPALAPLESPPDMPRPRELQTRVRAQAPAVAEPVAPARPAPRDWFHLIPLTLATIWLALSMAMLARLVSAVWAARRLLVASRPACDPRIEQALTLAAERLGLNIYPRGALTRSRLREKSGLAGSRLREKSGHRIGLRPEFLRIPLHTLSRVFRGRCAMRVQVEARVSAQVRCPVVWCWSRRPVVLLPVEFANLPKASAWPGIFCHELAHWKRRDHVSSLAIELLCCALPWQPLAWWAARRHHQLSELACDEWVLACGQSAESYADSLLDLVPQRGASLALAVLRNRAGLAGRIRHILDVVHAQPRLGGGWLAALISSTLVLIVLAALAQHRSLAADDAPAAAANAEDTEADAHRSDPVRDVNGVVAGSADVVPNAPAQKPNNGAPQGAATSVDNNYAIRGQCVKDVDSSPLPGAGVWLYQVGGKGSPLVEMGKTVSDRDGRFSFTGLAAPRLQSHLDSLEYGVVAFVNGHALGLASIDFHEKEDAVSIRMSRDWAALSGKVIDTDGRPVEGATIARHHFGGRPVPGLSATTDPNGRFKLNIRIITKPDGTQWDVRFNVLHPDHPETTATASALPADVVVTLPDGCLVAGQVVDAISGGPAAGAIVSARRVDDFGEPFAITDADGRFRLSVMDGQYHFVAHAKDRVCVALTDRECLAGKHVELPPLTLIGGGFISGQVVNTATGKTMSDSGHGSPILFALIGPSEPVGHALPTPYLTAADETGRFTLRAAPGENFPFFKNVHGDRMAWNTQKQPPVIVKEGETTAYDMLITPPVPAEDKLKAAKKLVEALPKTSPERTAQLIVELRKCKGDETETWCLLLRELATIGPDAVPKLCAELDRTTENKMFRRLAFVLRAIGDPRAVPALIRAIPKTLLPPSSDFGLIVADKELASFMQTHQLSDGGMGGSYFGFSRPEREIVGTLHRLTRHSCADDELFGISLSQDLRRQILQRRMFGRQSRRWQEWWEANWRTFTADEAYQKVHLQVADEPLPPPRQTLGKSARLSDDLNGLVLSPASEQGRYVTHFYDLDTGREPAWPKHIPRDETAFDDKKLAAWAAENGVDLMCVRHRSADRSETYVLRTFGMKVSEISARDLRNLEKRITEGALPEGRPAGELLMHYDEGAQRLVPDANAAFIYITAEGSRGVIETTDRVTRAADLTGSMARPPKGVGFFKGVRCNLKEIVP